MSESTALTPRAVARFQAPAQVVSGRDEESARPQSQGAIWWPSISLTGVPLKS